jgi:hypothetical protein
MVERFHSVRTTDIEDGVPEEKASFEMFRAEHARLYRALCMVAGSRDEAEEIAQDAFLRLWERWDRVSSMEAPTAYLFQVAMNVFRSRYRSTMRAMRRTLAQRPEEDAFGAIEDRDVVVRLLKRLTPSDGFSTCRSTRYRDVRRKPALSSRFLSCSRVRVRSRPDRCRRLRSE